jgi:hypothetical protein
LLDEALRELERALLANPRDRAASLRYVQALRRAGLVAPDAAPGTLEPAPNPGIAAGDLVLVARRAWPRPAFEWLEAMDALIGSAWLVTRLERDGLGALLEGPSLREARFPGDPIVGRSFGFASLRRLAGPPAERRSP